MLATASFAPAAAQKLYTLDECLSMALENNIKMRNAANDVNASRQQRKEAFTNYFPSLSASGLGFTSDKSLIKMDVAPGAGMSMLKNGLMGGVTLTQPVFAGGQIINSNRLADVSVEVSHIQQEQSANEVRLTAERYYWQVVTLKEKLHTLQLVENQLSRINRDVEAAVNAGITTRNDLLQVQLQINDTQSDRITLENSLRLSRMVLAQYIGAEEDSIAVDGYVPIETVPPFPHDLYVNPATSLPLTTSYRLLEQDLQANRLQYKMTVGKNLPTVSVGAGYLHDNLSDRDKPAAMAFVSVSVPISGWWGGSHAMKRQKINVMNSENRLEDSSELLIIGMRQAWNDLNESYKHIGVAYKSIEQSTENLRLNEDYYHAGTTTMTDLLRAETMFQQSRDKYVDAYARFRIRIVEYLQATGR